MSEIGTRAVMAAASKKKQTAEDSLVLNEIKLLREQICNIQQQLTSISEKYENRITELEKKVSVRDHEILELKASVQELQINENTRAQASLTNELEIVGIPEAPNENLIHLMKTAATKIGVDLQENDIDWVSRAGPRASTPSTTNVPRSVVVRLVRRYKRNEVLKAAKVRKNLTSSDIVPGTSNILYFNERLTKHNRELFRAARARTICYKYGFCWVYNGSIYIRKEDKNKRNPTIRILCLEDLDHHVGPAVSGPPSHKAQ